MGPHTWSQWRCQEMLLLPQLIHSGNTAKISLRATRLDLRIGEVARIHGATVMVFLGFVVALLVVLIRTRASTALYRRVSVLLGLLVLQAGVGYLQYFNDVPPALVAIHVAGATAVFAASVMVLLGCREPAAPDLGSIDLGQRASARA